MSRDGAYVLKGYGKIDAHWVARFFTLFKQRRVNIRKLVLLQNGQANSFSMLEIHFMLPEGEPQTDFLGLLDQHLALQAWNDKTLSQSP